ncbi:MAG: hypothetical protein ACFHWZ_01930 [Phycisphaerales bacterium]
MEPDRSARRAQRVTAVQLDQIGRIRAFASFGRREPDAPISASEALRIRGVLDRQGFRGTQVVLGTPRRMIRSTTLELPPASSGAPIDQLADAELARIHKLAPGSFAKGLWELPASNRAKAAPLTMAVTCVHEQSDALCEVFEQADLDVLALDLSVLATLRAARRRGGIARDPRTGRVSRFDRGRSQRRPAAAARSGGDDNAAPAPRSQSNSGFRVRPRAP